MSLKPHIPPFECLCPKTQLAVSGEGTSRNSFEITGKKGDLESCASTLWTRTRGWAPPEAGGVPPAVSALSGTTSLQPAQAPKQCYLIPRNQHMQGQGKECMPHIPFLHTDISLLLPLRFVFLQSSPPTNSELQSHLPGSMVSAELCQSWWWHHPNTSVSHKIQKTKPNQQNFSIVLLVLKFSDLFKATSKCRCILLDFLSQCKKELLGLSWSDLKKLLQLLQP